MSAAPRRLGILLALALPFLAGSPPARADGWSDARKEFRKAQKDPDYKVRQTSYLPILDYDGKEAVEEVLRAMGREENPAVLLSAMETLALFQSPKAVEALLDALRSAKGDERLYLVMSLGKRVDDVGTNDLLELARGKDDMLAAQAALSLGQRHVMAALPELVDLLKSDTWQLRAAGARAILALAGPVPDKPKPGEKPKPFLPAGIDVDVLLPVTAEALGLADGRDREDLIEVLERLTGRAYGNDIAAWKALASGTPPAQITPQPDPTPYICGVPILGRRVVIVIDISTCTDDTHPFGAGERLKEVCAVPGARNVPWYSIRTTKQFIAAVSKRLVQDLPASARFDVIADYQKAEPLFGRLTPANPGNEKKAGEWIEGLAVQNGPDHYTALMAALDISGARNNIAWSLGPDEVVLLTCAIPWAPKDPNAIVGQDEVGRIVGLKARMRMVAVHSIGVGPHPFGMMRTIAELTGGRYVDLSK